MSTDLPNDAPDRNRLLQQIPLLADCSSEVRDALSRVMIARRVQSGETIFLEGDPVSGLFIVAEGIVKISRHSLSGREQILLLVKSGDSFNDVAALDGGPNPATATAHVDTLLYCIPRADLRRIAHEQPDLAWSLIESIAKRTRHLVNMVQDLSMRSVKGRVAHLLLEQADAAASNQIRQTLTQEDLASRLGTVRELIGRSLRSLEAEGLIEFDRSHITILDPQRLASEAAA